MGSTNKSEKDNSLFKMLVLCLFVLIIGIILNLHAIDNFKKSTNQHIDDDSNNAAKTAGTAAGNAAVDRATSNAKNNKPSLPNLKKFF